MRYVIVTAIVVGASLVHSADPAGPTPAPVIRRQHLPLVPRAGNPKDINTDPLWRLIAKKDPPAEWRKVITPDNRDKLPVEFTLSASGRGPVVTFRLAYTQRDLDTMLHHVELFEPDPAGLDSPRADKGLVSVRLQTDLKRTKDSVQSIAEFTYPTNRLARAYLRITTTQGRLWPISLSAFLKNPDPVTVENDDINITIEP